MCVSKLGKENQSMGVNKHQFRRGPFNFLVIILLLYKPKKENEKKNFESTYIKFFVNFNLLYMIVLVVYIGKLCMWYPYDFGAGWQRIVCKNDVSRDVVIIVVRQPVILW